MIAVDGVCIRVSVSVKFIVLSVNCLGIQWRYYV